MGPWCKTALGFRPFFFFGALFAAGAVPLWLIVFRTGLSLPSAVLAVHWHGHEMVFGFATAIVAGFLLAPPFLFGLDVIPRPRVDGKLF